MAKKFRDWPDGKAHSISYAEHKKNVGKKGDGQKGGSLADRVKRDPKLLERALRDPGLRSKLPDKYLSKDQLKGRRDKAFRDDIGDIDNPLSGDSLIDVARGLVDREFDPLEADITAAEGRTTRQRDEERRRAGGYFAGLDQQFGASVAGQGAANAAAVQAAQARGAATTGAIDQSGAEAHARAAKDAAVRGGNVHGGAFEELAAAQAKAKTTAATEGQAQTNSAQQFGDAQAAFMRGLQGSTAQAGGETQAQIGATAQSALGELAAERAKARTDRKGAFTETLLELRGTEADRSLTRRSLSNDAEKAILDAKTDMAKLNSQAQIERANRRLKARLTEMGLDQKTAQAEADRASREATNAATNETSRSNNAASNTQSDRNSQRSAAGRNKTSGKDRVKAAAKRDDAIGTAQTYKQRRASRDDALALLTDKYGSDFARVAIGAIYDGGAKGHLDALLAKRYGIHVPRRYRAR